MKKLFSIDDDPVVLNTLKKVLSSEGYSVSGSTDPDEGLGFLRQASDINLVLLDVKMPKKGGFEVYNEIRTFSRVPVLFVTAYPPTFNAGSDEVVQMWQERFADGTTDIIYKPFDVNTLFEKVEGLIGGPEDSGADV